MSQENVEFAKRGYVALNQMLASREVDLSLIEELWTRDCVLRPSGILPESAEMHGPDGIARFIANQMEAFDELQVEPLEYLDAGTGSSCRSDSAARLATRAWTWASRWSTS